VDALRSLPGSRMARSGCTMNMETVPASVIISTRSTGSDATRSQSLVTTEERKATAQPGLGRQLAGSDTQPPSDDVEQRLQEQCVEQGAGSFAREGKASDAVVDYAGG
jgi:hypothetical protein